MPFIEMDPNLILKAIEGYENELAPENEKLESLYRQFSCPRCGSDAIQKEFSAKLAFSDPTIAVPRALLRCRLCKCLFNPHVLSNSGKPMLVELGNPAEAHASVGNIEPPDR